MTRLYELIKTLDDIEDAVVGLEKMEVTEDMSATFFDLNGLLDIKENEFEDKIDRTIEYLDALKGRIEALMGPYTRAMRALRIAEKTEASLLNYLKMLMLATPGRSFKGHRACLKLSKNPPSLKTQFDDQTIKIHATTAWPVHMVEERPDLAAYCDLRSFYVPRKDDIKRDIKAGKTLEWCRLESDVRVTIGVV